MVSVARRSHHGTGTLCLGANNKIIIQQDQPPRRAFSCRRARVLGGLAVAVLFAAALLSDDRKRRALSAGLMRPTMTESKSKSALLSMTYPGANHHPRQPEEEEAIRRPILVRNTASWADTPAGQVCHDLLPWAHSGLAYGTAWDELRPRILEASYYPEAFKSVDGFQEYISELLKFYTVERLRRSQAHPAPTSSIRKILQLLQQRIDDPENSEPIRILVMGGSVAQGNKSNSSTLDLPADAGTQCVGQCSYPDRLRHLLNAVLFPSYSRGGTHPLFELDNRALGGTTSQVGATALEFQLIPDDSTNVPHVVIWAYSPNDSKHQHPIEAYRTHKQTFVRAARSLRGCDDDLPLLVLEDDLYGNDNELLKALEETGSVYKTASWYNLMAVSFSNAARHQAVGSFNASAPNPMFGSVFEVHLGMGFHIAAAWTLLFNILGSMYDACTDAATTSPELEGGAGPAAAASSSNVTSASSMWSFEELPTKYRGRYLPQAQEVRQEWERNMANKEDRCRNQTAVPAAVVSAGGGGPRKKAAKTNTYSTGVCEYAFMAASSSSFTRPEVVEDAVRYILTENDGWGSPADGIGLQYQKIGWQASRAGASFSVELPNIAMETTSLTVLSMKSYGPQWHNSTLQLTVEVLPGPGNSSSDGPLRPRSVGEHRLSGYHRTPTSVTYPQRFPMPGTGPARVGDTIRATFELVGGQTFKISGLAFCRLPADAT